MNPQPTPADLDYAQRLVIAIYDKHWKTPGNDFKPFESISGCLSQIDNMTAGMVRANLGKDLTAELLVAINRHSAAVLAVRKAFGPPGEYGYGHPEGKALRELYDAHNALNAATDKIAAR